jgi:MOSC domain-containing protein YiiM
MAAMKEPAEILALARAYPPDQGVLELIVLRGAGGRRLTPPRARLSAASGLEGDRWSLQAGPDPEKQVSLMNSAFLGAVLREGGERSISGDNLVVSIGLSRESLPPGARLRIGEAELEVTDHPHTGCRKFEAWFGQPARELVDSPEGKALRLRGAYARVARDGEIRVGDPVSRIRTGTGKTSSPGPPARP